MSQPANIAVQESNNRRRKLMARDETMRSKFLPGQDAREPASASIVSLFQWSMSLKGGSCFQWGRGLKVRFLDRSSQHGDRYERCETHHPRAAARVFGRHSQLRKAVPGRGHFPN